MSRNWTSKDNMELKSLTNKFFGNDTFRLFTEEEKSTQDYKRYSELVDRKQKAMKRVFG